MHHGGWWVNPSRELIKKINQKWMKVWYFGSLSWQFSPLAKTKILANVSHITPMGKLIEMVQYLDPVMRMEVSRRRCVRREGTWGNEMRGIEVKAAMSHAILNDWQMLKPATTSRQHDTTFFFPLSTSPLSLPTPSPSMSSLLDIQSPRLRCSQIETIMGKE